MNNMLYLKDVVTLQLEQEKCIGCGICTTVCPHEVFQIQNKKAQIIERDACMECGACSQNCPTEAIMVQSGVGCVAGVIQGAIRGTEPTCDCNDGSCC